MPVIAINICQQCLDGDGEMCHEASCALCRHTVDLPIDSFQYREIPGGWIAVHEAFPETLEPGCTCPGTATAHADGCALSTEGEQVKP